MCGFCPKSKNIGSANLKNCFTHCFLISDCYKKTRKTLFAVCSSFLSPLRYESVQRPSGSYCAKCSAFVFESELSRLSHTTYHITIVITNIKKQNPGSTNLKNRITYTLKLTGKTVIACVAQCAAFLAKRCFCFHWFQRMECCIWGWCRLMEVYL